MTRFSKRSFVQLAGWSAVAALAALAGCSKKEETTTDHGRAGVGADGGRLGRAGRRRAAR